MTIATDDRPEPKKIFAANLRAKVVKMGLTYKEAIALLEANGHEKVEYRTFRAWVYGVNYPPVPTLIKLAEVFEIDDLYLFLVKECA